MIDALRAIERRECLSRRGLARQVGCSTGHLSMVFAGKRRPGVRFIRLVVRRYPEIRRLLASSLAQDDQDPAARINPTGQAEGLAGDAAMPASRHRGTGGAGSH